MTLLSYPVNSSIFIQVKSNRRNEYNVYIMQSLVKKDSKHQKSECLLPSVAILTFAANMIIQSVNSTTICWLSNRDIKVRQSYLNMICMKDLMLSLIPKIWLIRWWAQWNTGCISSLYKGLYLFVIHICFLSFTVIPGMSCRLSLPNIFQGLITLWEKPYHNKKVLCWKSVLNLISTPFCKWPWLWRDLLVKFPAQQIHQEESTNRIRKSRKGSCCPYSYEE